MKATIRTPINGADKYRRGVVGGYVDYLDSAQIERVEERISQALDPLYGYTVPGGSQPVPAPPETPPPPDRTRR